MIKKYKLSDLTEDKVAEMIERGVVFDIDNTTLFDMAGSSMQRDAFWSTGDSEGIPIRNPASEASDI